MGKSTIVKRLFLDVIDQGYGIPIFIELRRINESHDLISEIESQISSLTQNFNHQLLLELIMSGGFIFFLMVVMKFQWLIVPLPCIALKILLAKLVPIHIL